MLMLMLLGNFIIYISQQSNWLYHFLPEFSAAILCDVFLCATYIQHYRQREGTLAVTAVTVFIFFYPLYFLSAEIAKNDRIKKQFMPLVHFLKTPSSIVVTMLG